MWKRYSAWFETRNPREKAILAVAAIGGVLMVGLNNWALPNLSEANKLALQTVRDQESARGLEAQLAALEHQIQDPDAAVRTSLAQVRQRLLDQEPRMQEMQKSLVAADAMPTFLHNLLAGNRALQLLSLETLPAEPAIAPSAEARDKTAPNKASSEANKLYKHGMRVQLAGSYRDLLGYVRDLEQAPQRVLWGDLKLNAKAYPRVEMTLTVYTLSLDKTWLVL